MGWMYPDAEGKLNPWFVIDVSVLGAGGGLPAGGTKYEVLQKLSGDDYDCGWGPAHFLDIEP